MDIMSSFNEVKQWLKSLGLRVHRSGIVTLSSTNITGKDSVKIFGIMDPIAFRYPTVDEELYELSYEIIQQASLENFKTLILKWGNLPHQVNRYELLDYSLKAPKTPKALPLFSEKLPKMPRDLASMVEAAPYPGIEDLVHYDVLLERIVVNPSLWGGPSDKFEPLDDQHAPAFHLDLINRLSQNYERPAPSPAVMDEYLEYYAYKNMVNPFLEKIQGIKWDGYSRLDDCWLYMFGASMEGTLTDEETDRYLHALAHDFFTGTIARQFEPARVDVVPLLIGETGIGKTTLVERLGMGYYGSTTLDLEHPEGFYNAIRGKVIVELGEGSAIRKNDPDDLKEFLSRPSDTYRKAYGRNEHTFVRRFGAIITTNRAELLTDTTGNRRYYPIYCNSDTTLARLDDIDEFWIEQLWAEALELYKFEGQTNELAEVKSIAKVIQKLATVEEAETVDINEYLDTHAPFNQVGCRITTRLIYAEVFNERMPPYSKTVTRAVKNWQDSAQSTWKAVNSTGVLDVGRTTTKGRGLQRIKAPEVPEIPQEGLMAFNVQETEKDVVLD